MGFLPAGRMCGSEKNCLDAEPPFWKVNWGSSPHLDADGRDRTDHCANLVWAYGWFFPVSGVPLGFFMSEFFLGSREGRVFKICCYSPVSLPSVIFVCPAVTRGVGVLLWAP